jgi:tetratricopeptide (TPR) repeat protein
MSFFNLFSKGISEAISNEKVGEKYFRQALQCYQNGNQDDAIKFFTKSLEISPNHSAVYVNRAGCYMIQERHLQAYDDYLHAIDLEDRGVAIDAESNKPMALQNMKILQFFIDFTVKNGETVKSQITTDGLEQFTKRWAEVLFDQCLDNNTDTLKQFILEEIKNLEEMGGEHQKYALKCGVNHSDFSHIGNEFNTHNAYMLFKCVLCCFSRDPDKMFEIRTGILNKLISL